MKKILIIFTLFLIIAAPMRAQVFMTDDDMNSRLSSDAQDPYVLVAGGQEYDQSNYTPIGEGAFLLVALGGAYLFGKKKKKQ